jgi:hypothetical protein
MLRVVEPPEEILPLAWRRRKAKRLAVRGERMDDSHATTCHRLFAVRCEALRVDDQTVDGVDDRGSGCRKLREENVRIAVGHPQELLLEGFVVQQKRVA